MPDRGLPAARGGTAWRRRMINGGVGGLRASILMIHDAAVSRCDQKATAFIFRPCVAIDISALAPPFAASTASPATYCQVLCQAGADGHHAAGARLRAGRLADGCGDRHRAGRRDLPSHRAPSRNLGSENSCCPI